MKLRFREPTQYQLDTISTILGAVAGIAELLVASKRISNEDGQLIAGLALIAWGFFSNKPPRIPQLRRDNEPNELFNELKQEKYD
ncbi:hypothetical protein QUB10_08040 [Microcoleus sp. B5-D4]|uniref:hypothetical protein n=1 Tax=Microcoleus sp. B5-D4 TaxID=2818681 RepID=UPI002FD39923